MKQVSEGDEAADRRQSVSEFSINFPKSGLGRLKYMLNTTYCITLKI